MGIPAPPPTSAPDGLVLRPAASSDAAFLEDLYAEHRAREFAALHWPAAQLAAFLRLQYEARAKSHAALPGLRQWVVELHGVPTGTLAVAESPDQFRIVNLAVRTDKTGQGLGTRLIAGVIAAATAAGVPVTLSVEKGNRAAGLYHRLGFRKVGDDGVYMSLKRLPEPTTTAPR